MARTRTDILQIKLTTDGSGNVTATLAGTSKELDRVDKGFSKVNKSGSAFTSTMKALAGVVSVGLFTRLAKGALDFGSTLDDTSKKLGIASEQLQALRFAGEQNGIATDTMDMALQRFTRRVAEAIQGTGEAKDALAAMGVELTDWKGNMRPAEDLLADVADAMSLIPDQGERVRLAFKLFDSEGVQMVNVLGDGSAALREYGQRAEETGRILNDEMVGKLSEANNAVNELQGVLRTELAEAFAELAPYIQQAATYLSENLGPAIARVGKAISDIRPVMEWLISALQWLFNKGGTAIGGFAASIGALVNGNIGQAINIAGNATGDLLGFGGSRAVGGDIPRDGLYRMHAGEKVVPSTSIGAITVNGTSGMFRNQAELRRWVRGSLVPELRLAGL